MIKILSLFSGIGAFEKALKNLNIDFALVAYCDFDKYASKSYSAIHGVSEDMNLGDITKIDETKLPKDIDLITYGFPCQDISLAGVEHWFKRDDCFAIPDAELWFGLKELLKIETTEFDKAIMTFEKAEKNIEGVAHE